MPNTTEEHATPPWLKLIEPPKPTTLADDEPPPNPAGSHNEMPLPPNYVLLPPAS